MDSINIKIDKWIEAHCDEMIETAMELIRVRSISRYSPKNSYPFGVECAKVLDKALEISDSLSFESINHDYYYGTATLKGRSDKRIGIFVHLDTAPETDSWTFGPFSPYTKDGYLYGRGSSDNKGAAAAALYAMKCIKDLGIELEHSIELFLGCAKKMRMEDLDHYLMQTTCPDFSFVADARFPVCMGEKGSLEATLSCDISSSNIVDFKAGLKRNMVPDQAFVLLKDTDYNYVKNQLKNNDIFSVIPVGDYVKISTTGIGGHAAFPENTKNPIPRLARLLADNNLVTGDGISAVNFISSAFSDYYGKGLNIYSKDSVFGNTTHIGGRIAVKNGKLVQNINVRYIPEMSPTIINSRISKIAKEYGFTYNQFDNIAPHYLDEKNFEIADTLTNICNDVLKTNLKPYTMGGVTYAKKLTNAVPFGPNRSELEPDFEGLGGGHKADESMRIQSLLDFIKIYVLSIIKINSTV